MRGMILSEKINYVMSLVQLDIQKSNEPDWKAESEEKGWTSANGCFDEPIRWMNDHSNRL